MEKKIERMENKNTSAMTMRIRYDQDNREKCALYDSFNLSLLLIKFFNTINRKEKILHDPQNDCH